MGLVDVVIGVLAYNDDLDVLEGSMAGPWKTVSKGILESQNIQ